MRRSLLFKVGALIGLIALASLLMIGMTTLPARAGSREDVLVKEEKLISYGRDGIATVKITWHVRPPFYRGPVPFSYLAGIRDYGVQYGIRSVVWENFGTFKVTFQVDRNFTAAIPGLARAVGKAGEVLAEARAIRILKGAGFEVLETHFDKSQHVIFECRSTFNFNGWKVKEADIRGQKVEEYFFLWSSEE